MRAERALRMVNALSVALALTFASQPVQAAPFDDARDNIVAGKVGNAMVIIDIGAMGVNDQDDAGHTLLDYAVKGGSLDAVTKLLDAGADPTIAAKDGKTALALATTPELRRALTEAMAKRKQP